MTLLILGIALWILGHWFKRLAPAQRARLGDPGKGIAALIIVVIWIWRLRLMRRMQREAVVDQPRL